MSNGTVNFVKKSQVLMCHFEDCWNKKKSKIVQSQEIISNIKPEIGKIRPIVIVYPHKRSRLAIVVPFTTKKPHAKKSNTLHIPAGIMPGILGRAECWALCDMPQTISTFRLKTVFSGAKNDYHRRINQVDSILPPKFFKEIIEKSAIIFFPQPKSLLRVSQ